MMIAPTLARRPIYPNVIARDPKVYDASPGRWTSLRRLPRALRAYFPQQAGLEPAIVTGSPRENP